jgi:uncharacterized protein (DUF2147 family)
MKRDEGWQVNNDLKQQENKMKITMLCFCCLAIATAACANGNEAFTGTWITEDAKSNVEIFKCGEKYCGKIISLKEPLYTDGKEGPVGTTKHDRNNPDQAMKQRPIIGLQIMEGFTGTGEDSWGNGTIYDPDNGKSYQCKIKLVNNKRLDVRGFIGFSLLGRTTTWTR